MPTFTNASPAANEVLATSQPLLLGNNQYLQTSIGVDHNFTANTATAQDGYHKIIHFQRQAGNPAPIANVGQLFTKVGTASTQLFYEDAAGNITQLTTNVTPLRAASGYTFLPGSILMQWATVAVNTNGSGNATTTINFPIAFSNVPYSVVTQSYATGGSPAVNSIFLTGAPLAANFTVRNTSSGSVTQITYIAIGPI